MGSNKYVSSGLTLVAFVIAAAVSLYRKQILPKAKLINLAREEDRAPLISKSLEFLEIDPSELTKEQRYKIATVQIHKRARRFAITAWVIIAIAFLTAVIAIISIVQTKRTIDLNQYRASSSNRELLTILNLRAAEVERWFAEQKHKSLRKQSDDAHVKRLKELDSALAEFRSLHRQHINALENGQFVLAHDTLIRIHESPSLLRCGTVR